MPGRFRLTLAQLDPVLGDMGGNCAKAAAAHRAGRAAGADFVALPEMFLTGYQPQDLVLKPAFVADARLHLERLAAELAEGPPLGIGLPWAEGGAVHNVYADPAGRAGDRDRAQAPPAELQRLRRGAALPPGPIAGPFAVGPLRMGTPICEDAWYPDVAETMAESGADILMVPNGSPYRRGKFEVRMNHMVARVVETGLPLVYLNMVGGQDDQVFDGGSFVLNPGGALAVQLPVFEEAVAHVDFEEEPLGWRARIAERAAHPEPAEQEYRAMVEGLRGYCGKSGIGRVLLGLSGGVDSALVAAIAADALGPEACAA
jgi:NAD+ synthase